MVNDSIRLFSRPGSPIILVFFIAYSYEIPVMQVDLDKFAVIRYYLARYIVKTIKIGP